MCMRDRYLPGQVQASSVFQDLYHPQAVLVMREPLGADFVQGAFPRMPKGRMSQIVPQGNGLNQILVQPQAPPDGPRDLRNLQRMGQACLLYTSRCV